MPSKEEMIKNIVEKYLLLSKENQDKVREFINDCIIYNTPVKERKVVVCPNAPKIKKRKLY